MHSKGIACTYSYAWLTMSSRDRAGISSFSLSNETNKQTVLWEMRTNMTTDNSDSACMYIVVLLPHILALSTLHHSYILVRQCCYGYSFQSCHVDIVLVIAIDCSRIRYAGVNKLNCDTKVHHFYLAVSIQYIWYT